MLITGQIFKAVKLIFSQKEAVKVDRLWANCGPPPVTVSTLIPNIAINNVSKKLKKILQVAGNTVKHEYNFQVKPINIQ